MAHPAMVSRDGRCVRSNGKPSPPLTNGRYDRRCMQDTATTHPGFAFGMERSRDSMTQYRHRHENAGSRITGNMQICYVDLLNIYKLR